MNTTMGCISHTSLQMPEAGEETWAGIGRETVGPQMMPIPQYHPLMAAASGGQGVIQWGEERPYSCKMCVQTFTSEAHLNVHLRTHMATRPFRCVTCGRCFSNSSSLNVHERTHMVEKPYCCSVCAQTFSHLSSLKRHQRTHTGEKPYHCDVCGQAFTNKRNMKYHRSKHEEMALPQ
uniref:Gastrula zinc finger protein XlCGF67.1-like n=1 Tax=Petromyzon marinus TaxID=7757 RepID=A0AAJ7T5P8_PETMA|nr:gastrula zinc finger protein XlCGF67.1-like [Petromyzon marinus]